jgi:histidyl-tRNA synthetase
MRQLLAASETGMKGLEEVGTLFSLIESAGIRQQVELDLSLARGLNYYTGAIFEVKALDFAIGSICGGGRYDDLTGIFGLPNMSGVGISFGADRIYDVLAGLDLFPKDAAAAATVLFTHMGEKEIAYTLPVAAQLRAAGIACEVYPDATKLKKQFEYADRKGIPYLAIVGDQEMTEGVVTLKNLATGEQRPVPCRDLAAALQ